MFEIKSRANATNVISPTSTLFDEISETDRNILQKGFRPTPRMAREPEKALCESKPVQKH